MEEQARLEALSWRPCLPRPPCSPRPLRATPTKKQEAVKLGFITKFPVDFFFTLENAAKKWDKAQPGAKVLFAQGKSGTDDAGEIAAIQNLVAQGVKGIAITPTSAAVVPALDKAIEGGRQGRADGQRHPRPGRARRPSSRRTTSRAASSPASTSPRS